MKVRLIATASAALGLLAAPSFAASSDVDFSGTVPAYCTISNSPSATTMTYDTSTKRLQGTSSNFGFESNTGVDINLSQVTIVGAPANTSGYTWSASLLGPSSSIVVTSSNSAGSSTPYTSATPLTSSSNHSFIFTVQNGGAPMVAGTYSGKVTVDCTNK